MSCRTRLFLALAFVLILAPVPAHAENETVHQAGPVSAEAQGISGRQ